MQNIRALAQKELRNSKITQQGSIALSSFEK
jgi:hypothetical protein